MKEIKCPKCESTSIHAAKRGYSIGAGLVGLVIGGLLFWVWPLLPLVGLLAGFIGSQDVYTTCLKCGYRWKPGEIHKPLHDEFAPDEEDISDTLHKRLY